MKRPKGSVTGHGAHHLWSRYRMVPEQYAEMWDRQGGKCATCGVADDGKKRMCVDHDHLTRKIRGLLCVRCNTMVGLAEDRGLKVLDAIRQYLLDNVELDVESCPA